MRYNRQSKNVHRCRTVSRPVYAGSQEQQAQKALIDVQDEKPAPKKNKKRQSAAAVSNEPMAEIDHDILADELGVPPNKSQGVPPTCVKCGNPIRS